MAQYDGSIRINTSIDANGIRQGEREIKGSMSRISSAARNFARTIATAFAIGKIVQFGKEMLELGSDLQEVQNVVDVTFATMSKKVNEFAKNAAVSAGLSETMAKKYVGTFGAMAKSFGFSEQAAYDMSTALTQLSGDVASFYNISQDEAYIKLKSVFTGETETLKDLGVVMTQSVLDAYALANGFGKTTSAMSENEKVALRYRFVMEQLSGASGDFIRTSNGWANQVRILKLQFDSLKATIGQGLINVFTPVIKTINLILAKLATLANAFKVFTELITGNKSKSGGTADLSKGAGEDMGAGYNAAADGAENLAAANDKAAKSAGKAAKAAKGQLSALDKLNNLSSENSGGVGGAGGGGGAAGGIAGAVEDVDYGNLAEGETIFDRISDAISLAMDKARELAGIFKQAFFDGLGDWEERWEDIKETLQTIKNVILGIITDVGVLEAGGKSVEAVVRMIGTVIGSIASTILTIITAVTGGIAKFLEENEERIKEFIISISNIVSEIGELISQAAVAIAYVFESFSSEQGQQLIANILGIIFSLSGVVEFVYKLFRDLLEIVVKPFIENADKLKIALEGLLSFLSSILGTIKQGLDETFGKLNEVYDEHFKPFFDSIANGLSDTVGKFMEFWNGSVQPILDEWAKGFDKLWKKHIQPMLNKFVSLIGKVADLLKSVWENILKPLIDWIIKNVLPVILPIIKGIGDAIGSAFALISDVVGGIFDIFGGLIDFITGVFSGDWGKAWDGIVGVFKGIFNLIPTIIEGILNTAIGIINGLIGGINKLTGAVGIPSIPSIPKVSIPRLATGAVIPANKEFLAVLGDQKHGTNIEAPLSTIEQAVENVLKRSGNSGGDIVIHVNAEVDGKTLFQIVQRYDREQVNSTGNPSFVI